MFSPGLSEDELREEALRQLHSAQLISEKEQEINRLTEQEEVQLYTN